MNLWPGTCHAQLARQMRWEAGPAATGTSPGMFSGVEVPVPGKPQTRAPGPKNTHARDPAPANHLVSNTPSQNHSPGQQTPTIAHAPDMFYFLHLNPARMHGPTPAAHRWDAGPCLAARTAPAATPCELALQARLPSTTCSRDGQAPTAQYECRTMSQSQSRLNRPGPSRPPPASRTTPRLGATKPRGRFSPASPHLHSPDW